MIDLSPGKNVRSLAATAAVFSPWPGALAANVADVGPCAAAGHCALHCWWALLAGLEATGGQVKGSD